MKELINLLDSKEKKILSVFCFLLVGALLFLSFVSLGQRKSYFQSLKSLSSQEKEYQQVNNSKSERQKEWLRWEEARKDLEDLRKNYFYDGRDGIKQLRLDLRKIFDEVGIDVSQIRYDYPDVEKGKIKEINVTFNFSGSYPSLRKFLDSVEKLQRFLVIEKIDFLNIGTQGEMLELKIVLAGYYEN